MATRSGDGVESPPLPSPLDAASTNAVESGGDGGGPADSDWDDAGRLAITVEAVAGVEEREEGVGVRPLSTILPSEVTAVVAVAAGGGAGEDRKPDSDVCLRGGPAATALLP